MTILTELQQQLRGRSSSSHEGPPAASAPPRKLDLRAGSSCPPLRATASTDASNLQAYNTARSLFLRRGLTLHSELSSLTDVLDVGRQLSGERILQPRGQASMPTLVALPSTKPGETPMAPPVPKTAASTTTTVVRQKAGSSLGTPTIRQSKSDGQLGTGNPWGIQLNYMRTSQMLLKPSPTRPGLSQGRVRRPPRASSAANTRPRNNLDAANPSSLESPRPTARCSDQDVELVNRESLVTAIHDGDSVAAQPHTPASEPPAGAAEAPTLDDRDEDVEIAVWRKNRRSCMGGHESFRARFNAGKSISASALRAFLPGRGTQAMPNGADVQADAKVQAREFRPPFN